MVTTSSHTTVGSSIASTKIDPLPIPWQLGVEVRVICADNPKEYKKKVRYRSILIINDLNSREAIWFVYLISTTSYLNF
jgi:hypothetical protein